MGTATEALSGISIHAPLAGRDNRMLDLESALTEFQSTRPSRGATPHWLFGFQLNPISIHAPLAGRDLSTNPATISHSIFQSTRPSRGATSKRHFLAPSMRISIHAPLAGRDATAEADGGGKCYFNPRAPRGARQQMCTKITYIFALTHKRNTFSCQTPSVRALSKKLSGRFSHKIRCEPPCKTMCAAAPHYTISVPSGRYVCLQPKCSILLSYFFPK